LKQRFEILAENKWFGRCFEVDLWVRRADVGEVWVEVKSLPKTAFLSTRWRLGQRTRALRAAEQLGVAMWLALVDENDRVFYVDGISAERVDLKT
jgi:hypothetical protein